MNVIVIMLDSLRPDYLGCYGNQDVITPHMDRIARESTVFDNAYAECPITIPARTALLAGIYTHTNRPWMKVKPDDPRLAGHLRANGYKAGCIGDTVLSWRSNFEEGFDYYRALSFGKCSRPTAITEPAPDLTGYHFPGEKAGEDSQVAIEIQTNTLICQEQGRQAFGMCCPEIVTHQGLKWIDENRNDKFFLWLDYFEIHEPWDTPERFVAPYNPDPDVRLCPMPPKDAGQLTDKELEKVLQHYMGSINQVDEEIGKIVAKLEEWKILDDTLLIVMSDHGEPFGEHGTMRKYGVPVYDELSKIVLFMRAPGLMPAGKRIDPVVLNLDLAPTICGALGIERNERFEGLNMMPLINDEKSLLRETSFMGAYNLRAAALTEEWKYIDNRGEKENELFNRTDDPAEKNNLIADEQKTAADLHRKIWDFAQNWSDSLFWRNHPME